jgi:Rrf2 family transcriptional repressor of oqxAB
MAISSRFAHTLLVVRVLAGHGRAGASSSTLAAEISTSPVVIRRLLRPLCCAGVVDRHLGRFGGYSLARAAGAITLLDIYKAMALGDSEPFLIRYRGSRILVILDEFLRSARGALADGLRSITVKNLLRNRPIGA